MSLLKTIYILFRDTVREFFKDRATIYAAGLAYYTVFALAPLLVFVIAVAGFFIGRSVATEEITRQLNFLFGPDLAGFVEEVVSGLVNRTTSTTATLLSFIFLLFAAGGIFTQLKTAINLIWGVTDIRPANLHEWLHLARIRAVPFLMVFVFGFVLIATVIFEVMLSSVSERLNVFFPELAGLLPGLNLMVVPALSFVTILLIYRFLPNATGRWRDLAVGALVATLLFIIGRRILLLVLFYNDTSSVYGAAGSVILLLIWVYFSAQILLFGAEFIWVYNRMFGRNIRPNRLSVMASFDDW